MYKLPKIEVKIYREAGYKPVRIDCFLEAVKHLSFMKDLPQEHFYCIHLDKAMQVIGIELVHKGTNDSTYGEPRDILRSALLSNAFSIVVAHNHPNGDATPSRADIKATKNLVKSCKILDIQLLDSIVIGDEPVSIRKMKPYLWE